MFYCENEGSFGLTSQCFTAKKGVIVKLENKDGYHFFQLVREPGLYHKRVLWCLSLIWLECCYQMYVVS